MSEPDEDDLRVEKLRENLPRHVSNLARALANEALYDVDGERPDDQAYALARWFDAIIKVEREECANTK